MRIRLAFPRALPPPAGWEAAALALGTLLLVWSERTSGALAAVVAGADLAFHEAGHPLFGILGVRPLTILGGTLAQLAIPAIAAAVFAARGRTAPFGAMLVWIGVNLVNVGIYAADAERRVLPLTTPDPDGHDWWNLLGMLGVRGHADAIGGTIAFAGWTLQLLAPAWIARRWLWGAPAVEAPDAAP